MSDIELVVEDGRIVLEVGTGGDLAAQAAAEASAAAQAAAAAAIAAQDAAEAALADAVAAAESADTSADTATAQAAIAVAQVALATAQAVAAAASAAAALASQTAAAASAGTATTQATAAATSAEASATSAGVFRPYRTAPLAANELSKILAIEIYASVGGVAVVLPTNFGVREMGRDATSGGRFRMRFALYDGVSTYTQLIREGTTTLADGTVVTHNGTYLPAAAALAGQQWIDLYTITTGLGPAAGVKVGRALVDFGAGAVFGTYAGNIASSAGRMYENRLQSGSRFANDVAEVVNVGALASRVTDLESASDFVAGGQSIFRYVKKLRLFGANPAKFYSVNTFYRNDVGTRFDVTITQADDAAGTNPVDVCAFSTTGINYSNVLTEFTLSESGGSGITGTLILDLASAPSTWGVYRGSGGATFANLAIRADALVTSTAETAQATSRITTIARAQAVAVAASPAFLSTATDTYIQPIVADIYIEGGDAGERYCLNYEVLDLGSGNGRVRFTLRDTIAGLDVCTRVVSGTKAALVANTLKTLVLFQNDMAGYTGITATIWVNWSAITTWPGLITTYTTMAQTGLKANRTITPEEMRARFKRGPEPKTLLTVGAGTVTETHFNTVLAAVQSLYDPNHTVIRSGPFPLGDKCSFSNQVMVRVIDDAYSEQITLVDNLGGNQSPLVLPPWITIDLPQDAVIYSNEATNTGPTIEAPFSFRIRGGTIDCQGSGYAIHIDGVNGVKRADVGKAILRYPLMSIMEEVTFKGGTTQGTWTIGTGLSNGQDFIVDRCRVIMRKAAVVGIGMHDSPSTTDPAEITITDTYVNDVAIGGAYGIQMLKSNARTVQHRVTIRGANTASLYVTNSAGGAAGYIRNGKIDAGITITGTLDT